MMPSMPIIMSPDFRLTKTSIGSIKKWVKGLLRIRHDIKDTVSSFIK